MGKQTKKKGMHGTGVTLYTHFLAFSFAAIEVKWWDSSELSSQEILGDAPPFPLLRLNQELGEGTSTLSWLPQHYKGSSHCLSTLLS